MDDGSEAEFGPGDVGSIPPGHDAWIVGNEPFISIDFPDCRTIQSSSLSSLSCRTSKPMASVKLPPALADTEAKANETTREEKKVQKTDDEELKRQVAGGAGLPHHKLLANRLS
jgi:hypothetical protein